MHQKQILSRFYHVIPTCRHRRCRVLRVPGWFMYPGFCTSPTLHLAERHLSSRRLLRRSRHAQARFSSTKKKPAPDFIADQKLTQRLPNSPLKQNCATFQQYRHHKLGHLHNNHNKMATPITGAAFGAAMIAAGFYDPAVVLSQLKFENWHMFQAFLAATASSAYVLLEPFGAVL